MKYRRRVITARTLSIASDRQLVAAQQFNYRLERLIRELESPQYPLSSLPPDAVAQALHATTVLQDALIGGIAAYIFAQEQQFALDERRWEEKS
jgi:hypothetical protein